MQILNEALDRRWSVGVAALILVAGERHLWRPQPYPEMSALSIVIGKNYCFRWFQMPPTLVR